MSPVSEITLPRRLRIGPWVRWLPWLFAGAGFALDVAAYWPGQMSFDSAYAWWQARGGASTDIVPPVFILLWRLCDVFVDGPQLPFALHLALFWSGLALMARALRLGPVACAAMMALLAFTPVTWLLRGHVWTDVGLFSALTFACGALAVVQQSRQRLWLAPAAVALVYAALLRHNALPAIVPLIAWAAWLALRRSSTGEAPTWRRIAFATTLACVVLLGAHHWLARTVDRHVPLWPSLAQFDLAAMSVSTRALLLPDFMVGPGMDVTDLGHAFRFWSNTPMLVNTRHGMRDPFTDDYTPQQLTQLRQAWLGAIFRQPHAWLAHRWRLTCALFGTHAADWPHELIYVDAEIQYGNNPPIAPNNSALHGFLMRAAGRLRATALLAAWPPLLLGLLGLPMAWRHRREGSARCALIVLASAWLYALPLTVFAPAAELRYLGWPCVASLLAFACALAARHGAAADKLGASSAEGSHE